MSAAHLDLEEQLNKAVEELKHAEKTYKISVEDGKEDLHQLREALRQFVNEQ